MDNLVNAFIVLLSCAQQVYTQNDVASSFIGEGNTFCQEESPIELFCNFTEFDRKANVVVRFPIGGPLPNNVRIFNASNLHIYDGFTPNKITAESIDKVNIFRTNSNQSGNLHLTLVESFIPTFSLEKAEYLKLETSRANKIDIGEISEYDVINSILTELKIESTSRTPSIQHSTVTSITRLKTSGSSALTIKNSTIGTLSEFIADSTQPSTIQDTSIGLITLNGIFVSTQGILTLQNVQIDQLPSHSIVVKNQLRLSGVTLPLDFQFDSIMLYPQASISVNITYGPETFVFVIKDSLNILYPLALLKWHIDSIHLKFYTNLVISFAVISGLLAIILIGLIIYIRKCKNKDDRFISHSEKEVQIASNAYDSKPFAVNTSRDDAHFGEATPPIVTSGNSYLDRQPTVKSNHSAQPNVIDGNVHYTIDDESFYADAGFKPTANRFLPNGTSNANARGEPMQNREKKVSIPSAFNESESAATATNFARRPNVPMKTPMTAANLPKPLESHSTSVSPSITTGTKLNPTSSIEMQQVTPQAGKSPFLQTFIVPNKTSLHKHSKTNMGSFPAPPVLPSRPPEIPDEYEDIYGNDEEEIYCENV